MTGLMLAVLIPAAAALGWAWSSGGSVAAALAGAWAAAGCGIAWAVHRRHERERNRSLADMEGIRAHAALAEAALEQGKRRGMELEREHKETVALYGIIKSLAEALSWSDIKPKLEGAVEQYLGVSDFALYAAAQGKEGFKPISVRRLEGSPGASWATLERYFQEHGFAVNQARLFEEPEPALGLPLQDNGETLGYFYARAPKGADMQSLLTRAQTFAQEVGFAFRRVQLFQEVEGLSRIDGLTGVHRRGGFDERLQQEIVRAKTFKTSFGLMLLDIDHFKQLNDRYGHPFGDQVLKRVGEILNASVYETDFVARYGGEEFAILLPRAEAQGAWRKAEAIRRTVEAERFQVGFETVHVTISIGIAHFPRDCAAAEELVARADAALYHAKSQGRNQVIDSQSIRETS
ncbi:MAG: GGDEF domain-containing protein [Elusimicrobia bacterium]|nr:GGDEF domain-containing protein [Elusimicrobiota bacterium]